jgi:hypothetical protein
MHRRWGKRRTRWHFDTTAIQTGRGCGGVNLIKRSEIHSESESVTGARSTPTAVTRGSSWLPFTVTVADQSAGHPYVHSSRLDAETAMPVGTARTPGRQLARLRAHIGRVQSPRSRPRRILARTLALREGRREVAAITDACSRLGGGRSFGCAFGWDWRVAKSPGAGVGRSLERWSGDAPPRLPLELRSGVCSMCLVARPRRRYRRGLLFRCWCGRRSRSHELLL